MAGFVCTQTQRDTLAAAIASGVLRVAYADKVVQYQTLSEMRALLAEMDEYLAGASASPRQSRVAYSRE